MPLLLKCLTSYTMNGFIDSLKPIFNRYRSEVILLSLAFFIGSISLLLFLQQKQSENNTPRISQKKENHVASQKQTITADISGAVKNPFVYTLAPGSRIIDLIQKAGGISEEADKAFVMRNINYARIVNDQEKIYIPFVSDVINGDVLENKRIIDYTQPNTTFFKKREHLVVLI